MFCTTYYSSSRQTSCDMNQIVQTDLCLCCSHIISGGIVKKKYLVIVVLTQSTHCHVKCDQFTQPLFYWEGLVLWAINLYCAHSFAKAWQLPFLNKRKGENDCRKYFRINSTKECCRPSRGQTPDHQLDAHPTEPPRSAEYLVSLRDNFLQFSMKIYVVDTH